MRLGYLKKSINSAAESISAWITVLACPSIVAAFSVCRYCPAINEAAFSQILNLESLRLKLQTILNELIPFGDWNSVPFLLRLDSYIDRFID